MQSSKHILNIKRGRNRRQDQVPALADAMIGTILTNRAASDRT